MTLKEEKKKNPFTLNTFLEEGRCNFKIFPQYVVAKKAKKKKDPVPSLSFLYRGCNHTSWSANARAVAPRYEFINKINSS